MTVPPFETHAVRGRVLLLEHASLLREVQQLLLRSVGYETVAVDDPAVALGELDLHPIDALIIDATQREFVSADFLTAVRRGRPVSIIAVLWQPGGLGPAELTARGIDRVIEIPGNAATIVEVVDDLLGLHLTPAAPALSDAAAGAPTERVTLRTEVRAEVRLTANRGECRSQYQACAYGSAGLLD